MSIFTENGITFNNVTDPIITTGGNIFARGKYSKTGSQINLPQKVLNAIDIDWNNANVPGLPIPISNTSQVLKILGEIYSGHGGSYNGPDMVFLSDEEYNALEEYSDNTLYFIIGDTINVNPNTPENPSNENIFDNISTELIVSYKDNGEIIERTYTDNDLTNGELTLAPQKIYTLSGTLNGSIKIDTTGINITDDTELILDNVKILSETNNYGILYQIPSGAKKQKALKITLSKNSENYIYCSNEAEITDNQPAAIYSTNNLIIQGAGYLSVKNKGGHGLRGDEFTLGGPYIWIDANHDGIHGKNLHILGGVYYINNAKDAIGTSTTGKVMFYDGLLVTNNISEQIIDSKTPGLYFNQNLLTEEQISNCNNMSLLSESSFKSIFGNIEGRIYGFNDKPGEDILNVTEDGIVALDNETNTYNINYPYILIIGYISHPLIFSDTNFGTEDGNDATVYLYNAFINVNSNIPAFYYESSKEKIKIMALNDSINIIKNIYDENNLDASYFEGDCIKSENNIGIELKADSYLYISSLTSDGIDGGDVRINDSKGNLIISNCGQRGIKGNAIVIGPDATIVESIIQSYLTNSNNDKYKTYDGICYIKNNCQKFLPIIVNGTSESDKKNSGFADIYARNGKKASKGQFGTTNTELKGVLIVGTIGAIQKIDMGNANNLYYNSIITATSDIENPIPSTGTPNIIKEVLVTNNSKNPISF